MQKKSHSFYEACLNTASGFVISLAAGAVVFPMLGWEISLAKNLTATTIFTVISIVRSYVWRRVFNHRQKRVFDLIAHLHRQRDFSIRTFGPGPRTLGDTAHIRKELAEIEAAPNDVEEWIDVVILALDGAHRAGWEPEQIVAALAAKQDKNERRKWPAWRTVRADKPIEHVRG